jgi:hypothetical protein
VKVKTNLRFRNQFREAGKRNADVGDPALAPRLILKSGPESDLCGEKGEFRGEEGEERECKPCESARCRPPQRRSWRR